jgi:hypothetical protein
LFFIRMCGSAAGFASKVYASARRDFAPISKNSITAPVWAKQMKHVHLWPVQPVSQAHRLA